MSWQSVKRELDYAIIYHNMNPTVKTTCDILDILVKNPILFLVGVVSRKYIRQQLDTLVRQEQWSSYLDTYYRSELLIQ